MIKSLLKYTNYDEVYNKWLPTLKVIKSKIYVYVTIQVKGNPETKLIKVDVQEGDPFIEHEAIRVLKAMPLWNPGLQQGNPVDVTFTFPINFKLE